MKASKNRVVLIGIDGLPTGLVSHALQDGRYPLFRQLFNEGEFSPLPSFLEHCPAAVWSSVMTGCSPLEHDVLSSQEHDPIEGTRPIGVGSLKRMHLAQYLARHGLSTNLIGVPGSARAAWPGTRVISDGYPGEFAPGGQWQPVPDEVFTGLDSAKCEELRHRRIQPSSLGLDDLTPLLPTIASIDQDVDRRPAEIAVAVARTFSLHQAATWMLEQKTADLTVVRYPLMDDLCRAFLQFAPPKQVGVSDADFACYQSVIDGGLRLLELLLARWLELGRSGCQIMIFSAHDFALFNREAKHPAATQPPSATRRPQGFLLQVNRADGSSSAVRNLFDIAPLLCDRLGIDWQDGKYTEPSSSASHTDDEEALNIHELMHALQRKEVHDPLKATFERARELVEIERSFNKLNYPEL